MLWALFLICNKDPRKKFKIHSTHLLLFGEFFRWFPYRVGFVAARYMVKVSSVRLPGSCAILRLTHPSHKVFFKEGLASLLKDSFWAQSFDTRGRPLVLFSHMEGIVLCPTAGIHKLVLWFKLSKFCILFSAIFCVQEGAVMHLSVSFRIFSYYSRWYIHLYTFI